MNPRQPLTVYHLWSLLYCLFQFHGSHSPWITNAMHSVAWSWLQKGQVCRLTSCTRDFLQSFCLYKYRLKDTWAIYFFELIVNYKKKMKSLLFLTDWLRIYSPKSSWKTIFLLNFSLASSKCTQRRHSWESQITFCNDWLLQSALISINWSGKSCLTEFPLHFIYPCLGRWKKWGFDVGRCEECFRGLKPGYISKCTYMIWQIEDDDKLLRLIWATGDTNADDRGRADADE